MNKKIVLLLLAFGVSNVVSAAVGEQARSDSSKHLSSNIKAHDPERVEVIEHLLKLSPDDNVIVGYAKMPVESALHRLLCLELLLKIDEDLLVKIIKYPSSWVRGRILLLAFGNKELTDKVNDLLVSDKVNATSDSVEAVKSYLEGSTPFAAPMPVIFLSS